MINGCHLCVYRVSFGCHLCIYRMSFVQHDFFWRIYLFSFRNEKINNSATIIFFCNKTTFFSIIRKFIKIYQMDVIWMSFMYLPGVIWGLCVHLSDVIWVTQNYTIKCRFPIQLSKKNHQTNKRQILIDN